MAKKYYYLKDDDALEDFRNKNKGKNYVVNRFKGLGEMSVEETEETLLDPEVRIINQVTISDVEKATKLFDDLMGTAVTPRKAYIKEHSKEATYNAE
jgi:DNA gyrase subunit B